MKTKWLDLLPPADSEADKLAFKENVAASDPVFDKLFPGRVRGEPFASRHVAQILDQLAELGRQSDPASADPSGKDFRAFHALRLAGQLIETVAGWAIDHQAGLAIEGLEFVPRPPQPLQQSEVYLQARQAVDSHRHEAAGASFNASADPAQREQTWGAAANILSGITAGMRCRGSAAVVLVVEGIKDLENGYPADVFTRPFGRDKRSRTPLAVRRLELSAIGFVEFRKAVGFKAEAAVEKVADAYGCSPALVRTGMRKHFQPLDLLRERTFAQNAASFIRLSSKHPDDVSLREMADHHAERYGDASLKQAGTQYKQAKISAADTFEQLKLSGER